MDQDLYCSECGRRLGQPRIHLAVIVVLLVIIGGCVIQVYVAGEENHKQLVAINALNNKVTDLTIEQNELTRKIAALEMDLGKYKLRRPSYYEVQEFLRIDQTDKKSYEEGQYVCMNYAADLKRNAAVVGYNVSFVSVNFDDLNGGGGHSLNGAYLLDGSWVWIEPQKDRIYSGTIEDYLKLFLRLEWVKVEELAIVW